MEREIHRMELRLDALLREQERLSGEMERAIHKRTAIAIRYSKAAPPLGSKVKSEKPQELTQASAKKKIGSLKKEARILAEETSQFTVAIEERRAQLHEMTSSLERATAQYGDTEELSHQIQGEINDLLYQKQLNQERISYKQKYNKRLRELSQSGIDQSQSLQVERRLLTASQALENVREIIGNLKQAYPHLAEVLARVNSMADPSF